MWNQYESDRKFIRDNIGSYIEYNTYDVGFNHVIAVERTIGSAIYSGGLSVSVGIMKLVLHVRKLLYEHHEKVERHGDSLKFDVAYLDFIMDRLSNMEKCARRLTRRKALEDQIAPELRWPRSVDEIGCKEDCKALREMIRTRIMYVGGPETFGDAELSSDDSECSCANSELTSVTDVSSHNAGKSNAIKAVRIRHETNAYIKIARNHRLCIVVLPQEFRNKVLQKVVVGRRAIEDRGYTASDAWEDVEGFTGKLQGNLDMRRLLKKLMFSSKLLN